MVEDAADFLADFGEGGLLAGVAVVGIFGSPYAVSPVGLGMSTAEPRFMLPSASVPSEVSEPGADAVLELAFGAVLRFPAGVPFRYLVGEVQPDGTGWTTLILAIHPDQGP